MDKVELSGDSPATTILVLVDPAVTISSPVWNQVLNAGPISITAAYSDSNPVSFLTNMSVWNGSALLGTMSGGIFSWITPSLGTNTVTVTAQNNYGKSGSTNVSFLVDNPPDAPLVTNPAGTTNVLAGTQLTLQASASDPNAAAGDRVTKVEYYAGGTLLGSSSSSPYSLTWTPLGGSYSVTAKAYDTYGLSAVSAVRSITVANAVRLAGGTVTSPGYPVMFSGNLSDLLDGNNSTGGNLYTDFGPGYLVYD